MKILFTTEAALVVTVALFGGMVWCVIDMIQTFPSAPIAS